MTTMSLPIISTCGASGCSYNHDHDCHAGAITVVGPTGCATFVESGSKGGTDGTGAVGACHRTDCVHNSALECSAEQVEIGAGQDVATCLTFAAS